jgi:hypothetical protein
MDDLLDLNVQCIAVGLWTNGNNQYKNNHETDTLF